MPYLRKDYLTEQWVTIAQERANRPMIHASEESECPFCTGNSHLTPPPILVSSDGLIRVVPNKYPAFSMEIGDAKGYHEVLIDTPVHYELFHDFSVSHVRLVLEALQARSRSLSRLPSIRHVQIFKNNGVGAGASIAHSHWQIIALEMVPSLQQTIQKNFRSYEERHGKCYLCEIMKRVSAYLITENESFIAHTPESGLYTFGVDITAKRHVAHFEDLSKEELSLLAEIMERVLQMLCRAKPGLAYNICFQSRPRLEESEKVGHFFIQIIPRLGNLAGFEFSTGCYINSVTPEVAAEILRNSEKS